MPEYEIGNVRDKPTYEELMNTKAEKLLQEYKEFVNEDCRECKHIDYCRGGCPYNALAVSGHEVKNVDPHCEAYKMIFDKIDELMNQKLRFAFEELDQTVEKDFNFTLNVGFENMPKEGKKFTVMDIALK